ncbi:MAG: hypothetical protein ACYDC1_11945 [Limisphaerales bacterium]
MNILTRLKVVWRYRHGGSLRNKIEYILGWPWPWSLRLLAIAVVAGWIPLAGVIARSEYQHWVLRSQITTFRERVAEWKASNAPAHPAQPLIIPEGIVHDDTATPYDRYKWKWQMDPVHRAADRKYEAGFAEASRTGGRRPDFRCACEGCRTNSVVTQHKYRMDGLLNADSEAYIKK